MALQFTVIVFIIQSVTSVYPGEVVKPSSPFPLFSLLAEFSIHYRALSVRAVQFPSVLATLWMAMIMNGP